MRPFRASAAEKAGLEVSIVLDSMEQTPFKCPYHWKPLRLYCFKAQKSVEDRMPIYTKLLCYSGFHRSFVFHSLIWAGNTGVLQLPNKFLKQIGYSINNKNIKKIFPWNNYPQHLHSSQWSWYLYAGLQYFVQRVLRLQCFSQEVHFPQKWEMHIYVKINYPEGTGGLVLNECEEINSVCHYKTLLLCWPSTSVSQLEYESRWADSMLVCHQQDSNLTLGCEEILCFSLPPSFIFFFPWAHLCEPVLVKISMDFAVYQLIA